MKCQCDNPLDIKLWSRKYISLLTGRSLVVLQPGGRLDCTISAASSVSSENSSEEQFSEKVSYFL